MTLAKFREKSPPLENGDRLSRSEFERRYTTMPHIKKAELIERIVYIASPVRIFSHGNPHSLIITWLGVYRASTPKVDVADNATVRLDMDNEPQPDAIMWIDETVGGQSRISDDGYLEGAPELIVEVAASSASYDLGDKLNVYRRNQVREYIVWEVYENKLNWFRWTDGEYVAIQPDESGIIRSTVFPGLWLAVPALLAVDFALVLAVVQEGLKTPEHTDFVARLTQ